MNTIYYKYNDEIVFSFDSLPQLIREQGIPRELKTCNYVLRHCECMIKWNNFYLFRLYLDAPSKRIQRITSHTTKEKFLKLYSEFSLCDDYEKCIQIDNNELLLFLKLAFQE